MEEYVWLSKLAYHPVLVRYVHPILRRLAAHYGVKVTIAGPDDGDLETFLGAARDAIDRNVAGVMMMGWEHPRLLAAANAIREAGIGLVTVETRVPRNKGLAHVGTDWFRLGGAIGDRTAVLIGRSGKLLPIGLDGLGHPNVGFRGFLLRMGFYPGIEVLGPVGRGGMPGGDPEPVIRQHLSEHPDLAGIACFDPETGAAAARALESAGVGHEVSLITVGTTEPLIEYVRKGTIDVAFGQKHGATVYLAFQMLYAHRNGPGAAAGQPGWIDIPGNIDTGFFVVTEENANTYAEAIDLDGAFARRKLSQQLRLFSKMIESIEEIALAADRKGRIIYANPAAARMSGHSMSRLLEVSLDELFTLSEGGQADLRAFVECGLPRNLEAAIRRQDGSVVPVQLTLSPLRTAGGIRGVLVVAVELTERKRAQEALSESEERFRSLSEQSLMGIAILQDDRVKYINKAAADNLECTIDEILNSGPNEFTRFIHPDDAPFVMEQARKKQIGEKGVTAHYSYRVITKSGKTKWIDQYSKTVLYQGRPADLVTIVDITDRMEAEEAQRRLAAAVEQAAEMIIVTGTDGTIEYANPAFEQITGYTRQELAGKSRRLLQAEHQCDDAQSQEIRRVLRQGRIWSGRLRKTRRDGTEFQSEASISPVRDATGNIVSYVSVERDVTQEAALEARLRQAQKMEAVGQLAGGIAHDFNNLLTAVLGNAQLLKMQFGSRAGWAESLDGIIKASRRAADLTKQLLAFARQGTFRRVPVDTHQTIQDVAALLSRSVDKNIEIRQDLHAEPLLTMGDPTEVQNALMNLAINACDAMLDGGALTFSTQPVSLGTDDGPVLHGHLPPGRFVRISVSDTGVGIDPRIEGRIFEPFFTTKEVGKGTGLGLASVYGCVQSHGGDIRFDSTPEQGTTFHMLFPLVEGAATPEEPPPPKRPQPARSSGCVLLVDDEETVRQFARDALEALGYSVLLAEDGQSALEIFRREQARIHLVILDLIMPGLSGEQTLQRLREIDPDVRVVVASGHARGQVAFEADSSGTLAFLPKPFDVDELARILTRHAARPPR